MTQLTKAQRILQQMPADAPVPLMISVRPSSAAPRIRRYAGKIGQRRAELRQWQETLKRDLLAYIQTQQDGQALIVNAMPGTSQVIVKAPKSWWERELLGDGKLAKMPLSLMANTKSVYLID